MFLHIEMICLISEMQLLKNFDAVLHSKGFSRYPLLETNSPLQHLKRLSKLLNHPIYMKRDDLNGIGMGGNKLRKLEFLLADAVAKSATRIITVGALQSNHARLTAFVSRIANLEIDLVLKKSVDNEHSSYLNNGNMVLNHILDAHIHSIPNDERVSSYIHNLIQELEAKGEIPYFIPVGGSNMLGSLGYARAAIELEEQARCLGISFSNIALASGSGGTHAGLLAGYHYLNKQIHIQAYNVQTEREPLWRETNFLANEVAHQLNCTTNIHENENHLSNEYVGEGYGLLNPETLACIKLVAKTEGILLDPVYTGKAFTGFVQDIQNGKYGKEPALFIHTGGTPGLFAYENSMKS